MADKYEDLHDRIADEIHWDATVVDTLKWLDEHPDQVPGRTITESELSEAVENSSRWTDEGFGRDILSHFGIEVAPDPETTNAENLAAQEIQEKCDG